jgi:uncharacterized protein involved in response to NO
MVRPFDGPIAFAAGFRPFFIGCGAWAIIAMAVWISALSGVSILPDHLAPTDWHFNELLFGVIGAAMSGFILTAVPNWTGQLPLRGRPLMALFGLWCAGRLVSISGTWLGIQSVAIIDSAFFVVLFLVVFREIAHGRNWRNMPVAAAIGLFGLAHILFYLEALDVIFLDGASQRLGLAVVGCLLTLIGGRIVPSFTRNWLKRRNQEGSVSAVPGPIDKLAMMATVLGLLAWVVYPDHQASGLALIIAGSLNALRLARWRGWQTLSEPLLFVLHVGYSWLALSLLLLGGSILGEWMSQTDALHALSVGAAGTMILAVMSRAILGHTGRELHADWRTVLAFCSISTAALARLGVMVWPELTADLYGLSGGAWIVAFTLFLWRYAPIALTR